MRQRSRFRQNRLTIFIYISYQKSKPTKGNENLMCKPVFFLGVCALQFEDQQEKNKNKRRM